MKFHQFPSEEQAIRAAIDEALKGHEERLMTLFIQQGPEALRRELKVPNNFVWTIVFDHLVFNLDVLKRCIEMFFPFFKDYVLKNGPLALRDLFGIQDARYDVVFEKLLDDMVIARGLLFEHVHANIHAYLQALKKGQDIRAQLGLAPEKYETLWKEVVNFLLDAFSLEYLQMKQKEQTKTFFGLLQALLSR